jgi:hypothetical protein
LDALKWFEKRIPIISIDNKKSVHFENWNADSFYFYDGSGNLAECIVRRDLNHHNDHVFNASAILGINEIGLPTKNIERTNNELQKHLQSEPWKGDLSRFGTNGNQEGLFLLPNYERKETWFPSMQRIVPEPFDAIIECNESIHEVNYRNEQLFFKAL